MQNHLLSEDTLASLSRLILKHHPHGELPERNESTKSFCDAILALDAILIGRTINPDRARTIARLVMRDLKASGNNARFMADVAEWIVSVEGHGGAEVLQ